MNDPLRDPLPDDPLRDIRRAPGAVRRRAVVFLVAEWLAALLGLVVARRVVPRGGTVDKLVIGLWIIGLIANLGVVRNLAGKLLRDPMVAARALTKLAVVIGGRKRAWRGEEWAAGSPPGTWARVRHSAGLVEAAVRWRVGDLVQVLGRMLDWVLAEPRTEVLIVAATLCSAAYFWRTQGLAGLMSNFENVLATAVLTSGPGFWLRKHRGVPPARRPKRKALRR